MAIDLSDEIVCDFLVEAGEILDQLGEQLVDLEHRPEDQDLLNAVFRGFHTIKGGAGFIGVEPMVAVCHRAEDTFNLLRQGERVVDAGLMDVMLKVLDTLNDMFSSMRGGEDPAPADDALMDNLGRLARNEPLVDAAPAATTRAPEPEAAPESVPGAAPAPSAAEYPTVTAGAATDPEMAAVAAKDPEVAAVAAVGGTVEEITDEEFEHLLDALRGDKGASGTEAAGEGDAPEAGGDEIDEDEFESLLDELHGAKRAPGAPPPPRDDEITEHEFEALLDQLHGGAAPGRAVTVAPPAAAAESVAEAGTGSADEALGAAAPAAETATQTAAALEATSVATTPPPGGAPDARPEAAGGVDGSPAEKAVDKLAAKRVDKAGDKPAAADAARHAPVAEPTVRVDTGVLDRIMNMVGELVLVRNRISTLDSALADEELAKAVGNLDVVTADLQAAVMRTRMQPIRKVFGRFPRVVRDLARSLGKEVDLVLHGEDTDLDKNLVEALADPMVHLVRNAVDHGMEMPDERVAAGKPRKGTVTLSAEQEGDHILLVVADDGRGMDAEVLRRKAVEKGVMDEDAAARLDERDCFHLIFAPGFSTKAEISDVSGRGVGMDVVKSRITQLNGSVDIESKKGEGTRILIKVPLTLAIVPTLMVNLGPQTFALPLVNVREIFDLDMQRTNVVDGQLTTVVRGKPLPLFFLGEWLVHGADTASSGGGGGHVVVVHVGTQSMGFVVDQLLGQEEVVIKPLGAMLHGIKGLAGATITGDGRIALILDAPGLVSAYARRR